MRSLLDSSSNKDVAIRDHELTSLSRFVNENMKHTLTLEMLDGFFLDFEIPQIGKEFDLLKITENDCLNIELKSQQVSESDILDQLIKTSIIPPI